MSDIPYIEGELSKTLGTPEVQEALRPIAEDALAYVEQISKDEEG